LSGLCAAGTVSRAEWREWAKKKREMLQKFNSEREALIAENKRLRAALDPTVRCSVCFLFLFARSVCMLKCLVLPPTLRIFVTSFLLGANNGVAPPLALY
jgi:hypothetical protein